MTSTLKLDSRLTNLFFILIVGIAITLPYSLKLNNVLIIGATAIKLVLIFRDKKVIIDNETKLPLILLFGYYGMHILSLLWSEDLRRAIHHLEVKLSFAIFPLIILINSHSLSKVNTYKVLLSFSTSVLIACFYCHYQVIQGMVEVDAGWVEWNRWWNTRRYLSGHIGMHPTYMTIYVAFSSVVFFEQLVKTKKKYLKILLGLAIAYFVLFNFLLVSRVNLVIHIAVISYLVFQTLRNQFNTKILTILSMIILIIGVGFVSLKMPLVKKEFYDTYEYLFSNKVDKSEPSSTSSHFKSWYCAASLIDLNVALVGFGGGDAKQELLNCYKDYDYLVEYKAKYNAHNEYLSSLLRVGILGPVLLISCMLLGLISARISKMIMLQAFSVIVGFALIGESMLSAQKGVVFIILVYCLLINYQRNLLSEKPIQN